MAEFELYPKDRDTIKDWQARLNTLKTASDTATTNITAIDTRVDTLEAAKVTITNYSATDDTVRSTSTTGSLVNISQTDISVTVATGDTIKLWCSGSMSHGTASGNQLIYTLRRDTTALLAEHRTIDFGSGTGGLRVGFAISAVDTPAAGTYTYRLAMRTNTGTVYIRPVELFIEKVHIA